MVNVAEGTLNEVDVIMWLVEPTTYIGAGEQHIAELLSKVKTPVILAINKIDTVKDEEIIAKASAKGVKIGCFADTVEGGKKWRDLGVKFIGYGCDTYIFMQAAKADVAAFAK